MIRAACPALRRVACALATSAALAGSLPEVSVGPRPGPDLLYAPLASAPQFENAAPWQAPPLRVSGTEGYAAGEYLWQDWIFDSYGANTTDLPAAPPDTAPASATGAASAPTGDVVYPTDAAVYGFDAADLLEVRVKRVPGGLAYRITLNTMLVPDAAIAAIGIDTDANSATGTSDLGHGLGALGTLGVEHVIATWGTGAELDGAPVASSADTTRNQIDVVVPLVPPPGATWRHYLVVGLHNAPPTASRRSGCSEGDRAGRVASHHAAARIQRGLPLRRAGADGVRSDRDGRARRVLLRRLARARAGEGARGARHQRVPRRHRLRPARRGGHRSAHPGDGRARPARGLASRSRRGRDGRPDARTDPALCGVRAVERTCRARPRRCR